MPPKHCNGHCKATQEEGDPENLEKGYAERIEKSGILVQLREDGGRGSRQSWIRTEDCGLQSKHWKATQEKGDPGNLEKGYGERIQESGIQVQLREDAGSGSRQSWTDTSGLWTTIHWHQLGKSCLCSFLSFDTVCCALGKDIHPVKIPLWHFPEEKPRVSSEKYAS